MKPNQFLFGCAYYDEYMPESRIDEDFSLMRDAHMNVIRIGESTWSTWEPEEGRFDFTSLINMLEGARKYGLSVIIGTPTYAFPSWLSDKCPDVLTITSSGRAYYGHRQLTDITNETYLMHAERVLRRMLEVTASYNDVIIGYQLDNETRSAGAAGAAVQKLFAQQMKERFCGDLDAFNREFGMDYWSNRISSWDTFPDIRGTINGSLDAEYRAFLRGVVTDFHAWLKNIIDDYRTPEQFITHNFDYAWTGYSFGLQPEVDQKAAAVSCDIAGVDIYHPSAQDLTGAEIAMGGAIGRSLKKDNYLVLETQAQGRPAWTPYPGQLTLQALSHISSGSVSVMYWHWHSIHNSYETYWKGILSHNLKPNAPYLELAKFGKFMSEQSGPITGLKKNCSVAILLDNRSLTGIEEFPLNGEEAYHGDPEHDYNHMMRRWFDSCYKMNIETDFIYADDDFSSYRLIIVPALCSASEQTIHSLRTFVEQGGHLLLTPKCFFSDTYLKVFHDDQPHGFTDLAGATYDQFTIPADVGFKGTLPLTGKASGIMELYLPSDNDGAQILASYDHPYWGTYAAVLRKGTVTVTGCILDEHDTSTVLKSCLDNAGIAIPDVSFPVIVKEGINRSGDKITFVFNYSTDPSDFRLTEDLNDLISGAKLQSGETIDLPPWGYRIFISRQLL